MFHAAFHVLWTRKLFVKCKLTVEPFLPFRFRILWGKLCFYWVNAAEVSERVGIKISFISYYDRRIFLFLPTCSIFSDMIYRIQWWQVVIQRFFIFFVDKSWLSSASGKHVESYIILNYLRKLSETRVSTNMKCILDPEANLNLSNVGFKHILFSIYLFMTQLRRVLRVTQWFDLQLRILFTLEMV